MNNLIDNILENISICNTIEAKKLNTKIIVIPQSRLMDSLHKVDDSSLLASLDSNAQINILQDEKTQELFKSISGEFNDVAVLNEFFGNTKAISCYTVKDVDRILPILRNEEVPDKYKHFFLNYPEMEHFEKLDSFIQGLDRIKSKTDFSDEWLVNHKDLVSNMIIGSQTFLYEVKPYQQMIDDIAESKTLEEVLSTILSTGYRHIATGEYIAIKRDIEVIAKKLPIVLSLLDQERHFGFINSWLGNHQLTYDLNAIIKNKDKIGDGSFVNSRINYIALCYSEVADYNIFSFQEDIVIYALANKKRAFLKLIRENKEAFAAIKSYSVLYTSEFYDGLVNINTLNVQNLHDLANIREVDNWLYKLEGHTMTFKEFKILYRASNNVVELYYNLDISSIDTKLAIIQEITANAINLPDSAVDMLPHYLEEKKLSDWRSEFGHIKDLDMQTTMDLLLAYDDVEKFIPYINNKTEARRICQNISIYRDMLDIEEVRDSVLSTDTDWLELKAKLQISNDFVEEHKKRALQFIMDNGADIMYKYLCRNITSAPIVQKLVTAEISGQYNELKYHSGDLEREISKVVPLESQLVWEQDCSSELGDISVKEDASLLSTMQLGEIPIRTCMSYKDGEYSECLLSNFDSNKKIVYAKVGEETVFRAIIRLTKGSMQCKKADSFEFYDVTKPDAAKADSSLVLFLERPYLKEKFASYKKAIFKLVFSMLRSKAKQMGAILICSLAYSDWQDTLTRTRYSVYISQSKAGSQYLDSLGGSATSSNDRRYYSTFVYVHKDDVQLLN